MNQQRNHESNHATTAREMQSRGNSGKACRQQTVLNIEIMEQRIAPAATRLGSWGFFGGDAAQFSGDAAECCE